jgi:hypothetical protein
MAFALTHARVFDEDHLQDGLAVVVEGKTITALVEVTALPFEQVPGTLAAGATAFAHCFCRNVFRQVHLGVRRHATCGRRSNLGVASASLVHLEDKLHVLTTRVESK